VSATVTGERVSTAQGGFNPTYQRHVAAYRHAATFLGPGSPVLDLGCGTGHSFAELAPRQTMGVDADELALQDQERPTFAADMRATPFDEGVFASVVCVHAIEHVPDPENVAREAARVLRDDGVAVFVTPNRLTFARPDEIIDPYHEVELDPTELHDVVATAFGDVQVHGLFGTERYLELVAAERRQLDRLLRLDPLRLRRLLPRRAKRALYDQRLRSARLKGADERAAAITPADFYLGRTDLEACLDVVAVAARPRRRDGPVAASR
jgi:SAM-dependent methyltransferase